jgi:hypothetical protein
MTTKNLSKIQKISLLLSGIALIALSPITHAGDDFAYFSSHFIATRKMPIKNHIELLFTQNAEYASLLKRNHQTNCAVLTLWPINHNIQYFTDEPVREAGYITPEHFVTLWEHQKSKQSKFKPNVDIQASIYDKKTGHMIPYSEAATLNSVKYDAHLHIMHYVACPIKGSSILEKKHLKSVTIFFDNFNDWPYA